MVEITIRKRSREDAIATQRKFYRKTARGKVLKVIRERYLRSDVPCDIESCRACVEPSVGTLAYTTEHEDEPSSRTSRRKLLPARGCAASADTRFAGGHFVLLDTNVVLHQLDLLESGVFAFGASRGCGDDSGKGKGEKGEGDVVMILCQTVLEEVRHRSLAVYARVRRLVADEERKVGVFWNELREDTALVATGGGGGGGASGVDGETVNDRNDRSIRTCAAWYAKHVAQIHNKSQQLPPPTVVLVTDDAANRRKAQAEGLCAMSVKEYVEGMPGAEKVLDLLAVTADEDAAEDGDGKGIEQTRVAAARVGVVYPEHLPQATLLAGVKTGELHQGYFSANPYNYLEGTVSVPAFSKPVLLVGRENMNRSVQGDVVAVEVFDESEWKAPGDAVVEQESTLRNDDPEDSEEEEDADKGDAEARERRLLAQSNAQQQSKAPTEKQPTGRVVGIIKRNWRACVCHIDRTSIASSASTSLSLQSVFAQPVSRALPRIRLRTRQAPTLLGQKVLVAIDRWTRTSRYPEGHFVRALGAAESKEAEQESLLLEYEVPYRPFGRAVLDCLPVQGEQWVVPQKSDVAPEWRDREDLRELIVCSIDPPGCQDIDDALHARRLPNGNIEAGVHIADVSHFVLPDNPMDTEAAARGTTVYLVDKRIDMLPALLGTNLCSLRPYVERLAFSVIWELTENAEIVNVRFMKSVIASKAAFTYEEAQIRKDDPHQQDDLTQSIRLLNSLAIKLRAARMAAGALNLASPEVKIHLDSAESSDPIDVEQKELRETNSLVEEFMLLANISVARRIQEAFPQTAVLRRHLPPPKTNFEKLQDLLKKRKGMDLDVSSSGALAASLDKCIDPNMPSFNTLVRIMATRCMLPAEYFCSGSVSRDTFGHYGLASPIYTHFTSPIRRYADVLVHRQLAAAINYAPLHASLHSKAVVERVLGVVNKRHRLGQMAGRASVEFYVGLALRARARSLMEAGQVGKGAGGGEKEGEVREEAFVIRTFRNGLGVFVSKLGLEGLVMFKRESKFDAENYTLTLPGRGKDGADVTIAVFDAVQVRITVEKDRNTQRGAVKMTLVSPVDSAEL